MTYGTVAGFKLRLRIAGSGDDDLLSGILSSASDVVNGLCGKSWPSGTDTRSYGVTNLLVDESRRLLFLDGLLDVGQSVTVTNGDGEEVEASAYTLFPLGAAYASGVCLDSGLVWTLGDGDGLITVEGTWYVPPVVAEATYLIGEAFFRRGAEETIQYGEALERAREMLSGLCHVCIGGLS